MATGQQKLTAVILFIAFICAIVALAVPQWTKIDDYPIPGATYACGLWSCCGSYGGSTSCNDLDSSNLNDSAKAIRAFSVLAFIFAFLALVATMAAFFAGKGNHMAPAILAAIAGFCAMISFSIFVDKTTTGNGVTYGAGLAFAIITWLLEWAGAGLAFKAQGGAAASG